MDSGTATLIAVIVSSIGGPAILLWMKGRSDREQRREEAAIRRAERAEDRAREDAREARALDQLTVIKKQTDGVFTQVTALAKSAGRMEGHAEATKEGEATAATLARGQQEGRDAERASGAVAGRHDDASPLPVADERTATAAEAGAAATEALAHATTRIADAAETKKSG